MKRFVILADFLLIGASLKAQVPSTLNYQGRVLQNGQPFDGTGHFVFGIYEGSTLLWTNKLPVPSPLNDPVAAIDLSDAKALEVRNGVFSVRMGEGDANNAPVGTDVFFKFDGTQRVRTDVKLKVWFSPTAEGPYLRLDPDITFASVPFAQVAGVSETVLDGAVTLSKIEPGWGTVPPGTIIPYGIPGSALPAGYVECNGAEVNAVDYPRLAALLGNSYGNPSAEGKVKLPDFRGRVPMGQGQGDTQAYPELVATNWALGQKVGMERYRLTNAEMPRHDHGGLTLDEPKPNPNQIHIYRAAQLFVNSANSGFATGAGSGFVSHTFGNYGTHQHKIEFDGNNQPHNIIQPSLVVRYLMKY